MEGTPHGFEAARLTQARLYNGFSKKRLAGLIGVSPATVSRYENGQVVPPSTNIAALANALGVRASFFAKPAAEPDLVNFRTFADVKKTARSVHAVSLSFARDVVSFVENYAVLPELALPELPADITTDGWEERVDAAAASTRDALGVRRGPIPNLTYLAESAGVIVVLRDLGRGRTDGLSSMIDNRAVVVIDGENFHGPRMRFSLAHELAHLVLHRHLDRDDVVDGTVYKRMEYQAHRFAGSLLFPQAEFPRRGHWTLGDFLQLKPVWGLSVQAMMRCALNYGEISDNRYRGLCIDVSQRGWRKQEPFDDEFETERPTLLRDVVHSIVDEIGVSPRLILEQLALPDGEVETITGLPHSFFVGAQPRFRLKEVK